MAGRRGNGEGYIFKNKEGYWEARITKGYNAQGKQQLKYFSAKTRQEVVKKLNDYIAEKNKGTYLEPNEETVAQWLDYWHKNYVINNVKISTRVCDESIIEKHLKPRLGKIKLIELKGKDVQKIYNEMMLTGRVDGKGGLSAKTIRNIHLVLHRAMEQAVKDDLIIKNPLKSVVLPRIKPELLNSQI